MLGALLGAALWAWCAHELWHSSVPSGLDLANLDVRRFFTASFLDRSASYERFLTIDSLLARLAVLAVLIAYARRGAVLMRESAAGRIGTGILLAMLGYALIWLAEIPFELAAVWWERRHGVSHQSYGSALLSGFLGLGTEFVFVALAFAVWMALAVRLRRTWWIAASPVFAALAFLFAFVGPFLIPQTHPLRDPVIAAEARRLATREGVPNTRVLVQTVSRYTTDPNAEAVGIGPTRRVVLWDTLLDGRFSRAEVDVVIAHELGHIAHGHLLKRVGWLILFLIPATTLMAYAATRRGGMARPEAIPVALLALVGLQLLSAPLSNIVSRHEEAEADWSAHVATREPGTARALFQGLATSSLANPDPPTWSYVLYATHPSIAQRIAMTEAWRAGSAGH